MNQPHKSDLVDITCVITAEGEKAIAIADGTMEKSNSGGKRLKWFWLPLSQIEVVPNGENFIVTMPEWLALEKGLI